MRIGFFTNNYLPRACGVTHALALSRKGLVERGHQVFIFAPKYELLDEQIDVRNGIYRFHSFCLPEELGNFHYPIPIPYSLKIKQVVKKLNLDIIHAHQPYLLGGPAKRYARELGIPLVFTNHTQHHKYFSQLPFGLAEFAVPLMQSLLTGYANEADQVIVPSRLMKEKLVAYGVRTPISVIPTGINLQMFARKKKKPVRKKLNIPLEAPLLLVVSRLTYEKQVEFIVEAFPGITKKLDQAHLIIVGEGWERKRLELLSEKLGVAPRVHFVGQKSYDELADWYAAADCFVYSSAIDSQALVLIEAMAAGLPIVATNASEGSREFVKNGVNGLLVSPRKELFIQKTIELLLDKQLRQRFGRAARKHAKRFSYARTAQLIEKTYQSTIMRSLHNRKDILAKNLAGFSDVFNSQN